MDSRLTLLGIRVEKRGSPFSLRKDVPKLKSPKLSLSPDGYNRDQLAAVDRQCHSHLMQSREGIQQSVAINRFFAGPSKRASQLGQGSIEGKIPFKEFAQPQPQLSWLNLGYFTFSVKFSSIDLHIGWRAMVSI